MARLHIISDFILLSGIQYGGNNATAIIHGKHIALPGALISWQYRNKRA